MRSNRALPLLWRNLEERRGRDNPRIVDHDIESSKSALYRIRQAPNLFIVADIAQTAVRLRPHLSRFSKRSLESALIPMSYKKKACAFARKRPCHAPPDSSARAGNERDLAGELHPEASSL